MIAAADDALIALPGTMLKPADDTSSRCSSAPPVLSEDDRLQTDSLFAFNAMDYASIFTDIRCDEEYNEFYNANRTKMQLPPPLDPEPLARQFINDTSHNADDRFRNSKPPTSTRSSPSTPTKYMEGPLPPRSGEWDDFEPSCHVVLSLPPPSLPPAAHPSHLHSHKQHHFPFPTCTTKSPTPVGDRPAPPPPHMVSMMRSSGPLSRPEAVEPPARPLPLLSHTPNMSQSTIARPIPRMGAQMPGMPIAPSPISLGQRRDADGGGGSGGGGGGGGGSHDEVEFPDSVESLTGKVVELSTDQEGCRLLQGLLDKAAEDPYSQTSSSRSQRGSPGTQDTSTAPSPVDEPEGAKNSKGITGELGILIVDEVIGNAPELMIDPFGNYLCQKVVEKSSPRQRSRYILRITEDVNKIALNLHGTRSVQALIECVQTSEEVQLVVAALRPHVVSLVKDLNGNHVIQKCLHCFGPEDSQFVFDVVAENMVEVATHRHGCCVLQRCIDRANVAQQRLVVDKVADHGLQLVQDPFGNYVVQYVLDLSTESKLRIMEQFLGSVARLCTQKFSSNVIEKCIDIAHQTSDGAEVLERLINELADGDVAALLGDPFGNYVVQRALNVASPKMFEKLCNKIRPRLPGLKSTPQGKRVYNKLLKNHPELGDGVHRQSNGLAPLKTTSSNNNQNSNVHHHKSNGSRSSSKQTKSQQQRGQHHHRGGAANLPYPAQLHPNHPHHPNLPNHHGNYAEHPGPHYVPGPMPLQRPPHMMMGHPVPYGGPFVPFQQQAGMPGMLPPGMIPGMMPPHHMQMPHPSHLPMHGPPLQHMQAPQGYPPQPQR